MRQQLLATALVVVGVCASADRASAQVYSYPYTFPAPVPYVYPAPVVYTSPTFPLVRTYSTPVVYSTYTAPVVIPTRMWVVTPGAEAATLPAPSPAAPAAAVTASAAAAATSAGAALTAGGVTAVAIETGAVVDATRPKAVVVTGPPVFQLGHSTYTPIVAPVAAPQVNGTTAAVYYYSPYGYGTYNAFSGPYLSVGFGRGYGGWGWGRGWSYGSWGYSW